MGITFGRYFNIDDDQLQAVLQSTQLPEWIVLEYLVGTDWPNADEHQEWLEKEPPYSIARWVEALHQQRGEIA